MNNKLIFLKIIVLLLSVYLQMLLYEMFTNHNLTVFHTLDAMMSDRSTAHNSILGSLIKVIECVALGIATIPSMTIILLFGKALKITHINTIDVEAEKEVQQVNKLIALDVEVRSKILTLLTANVKGLSFIQLIRYHPVDEMSEVDVDIMLNSMVETGIIEYYVDSADNVCYRLTEQGRNG